MNKTEKQIAKYQLQQEQKTLRELKQVYAQASKDLQKSINDLNLRTDMQNLQSIIMLNLLNQRTVPNIRKQ